MRMPVLALAFALLLLAGCGGEAPLNWTPTPATPSPSPVQGLSEGDTWWAGVDPALLPTEPEDEPYVDGPVSYGLLQSAPERELFLYEVHCAPYDSVQYLLRQGDTLGEALRLETGRFALRYNLAWGDYDGDGEDEYAISLVHAHGTGSDLILGELSEDGWTFFTYDPADYSAELSAALGFQYAGDTVTLSYGGVTVSYTLGPSESGPVSPIEDFSQVAFLTPSGDQLTASFGAGAVIDGSPVCFSLVMADVIYDGEGFSLSNLRLLSTTGV